jgi:histone-binding protein RBBP4
MFEDDDELQPVTIRNADRMQRSPTTAVAEASSSPPLAIKPDNDLVVSITPSASAAGSDRRLDAYSRAQLALQAVYRQSIRKLYNFNASQSLEWPCLSCAWLPDRKNVDPDRDYSLQYIAVSTQAPPSVQNYVNILEFAIPIEPDDNEDDDLFGGPDSDTDQDERAAYGRTHNAAMFFKNVKGHSRIDQTIPVDGQVLKLRAMPQNTDILAVKSTNGLVSIYDLARRQRAQDQGEPVPETPDLRLRGHKKAGFGLDWHKSSTGLIASGSDDGMVMVWNIEEQIRRISDPQPGRGDEENYVGEASSRSGDIRPIYVFEGHKDVVHEVSWHANESHMLGSASGDNTIKLWDTRLKKSILEFADAHRVSTNTLQFHPLASFQIASGGHDNIVKLWDIRKNNKEVHQLVYHSGPVTSLDWASFSESVIASGSQDGRVVIWDLEKVHAPDNYNDEEFAPVELSFVHLGHISRVTDLCWCPNLDDEWMLASCDATNSLQYYRPRSDVVEDYLPPDMFDVDNGD